MRCFSRTGVSELASHNMSELPAAPLHRATMRRVTELRASTDDGRVPHPLLPPPPLSAPSAPRPPPPPRVTEIRERRRTLPARADRRRKRPKAAPAGSRARSARFPISTRATRLLYQCALLRSLACYLNACAYRVSYIGSAVRVIWEFGDGQSFYYKFSFFKIWEIC